MHLLSLVNMLLGQSAIFDLALAKAALLGVGCRSVFSSHKYIAVYSMVKICPLVIFWVHKVLCLTSWPFVKILRAKLCPWDLSFDCSCPMFSEEAQNFSANLMTISAQSGGFISSDLIGGLCSFFWVDVLLVAFLWWCSCRLSLVP